MINKNEVIVSIKPKWCDLIVSGDKTYEIRKTKPDISHGPLRVFIYRTNRGKVIGEFTLRSCTLGLRHCIDDEELFNYLYRETKPGKPYSGGWAWKIDDLIIYDQPKRLDLLFGMKRPPQSWCYGGMR